MSVQALGWVFDHSAAKGSDRLVLLSIANHAGQSPNDGAWEAWPGIETMQREAGLDRKRTVNDALARLERIGQIDRLVNGAPDERIRKDRRPNLYRILLDNGVTCSDTRCRWCGVTPDATRDDDLRRHGVTDRDATGCRETSPEPSVEPPTEPSGEPQTLELVVAAAPAPDFAAFWEIYPRHIARADAERAWAKAVKSTAAATIIDGATRFATETAGLDPSLRPYPATWLNGQRWTDPPGANVPRQTRPARGATAPITTDRNATPGRIQL